MVCLESMRNCFSPVPNGKGLRGDGSTAEKRIRSSASEIEMILIAGEVRAQENGSEEAFGFRWAA